MEPLQVAAQMQPVSRRKDGSVTLKFISAEEISSDQLGVIDTYREVNGYVMFSPDPIANAPKPQDTKWKEAGHTRSQELRMALRALHIERGGTDTDFDDMYDNAMRIIIKSVTSKLAK